MTLRSSSNLFIPVIIVHVYYHSLSVEIALSCSSGTVKITLVSAGISNYPSGERFAVAAASFATEVHSEFDGFFNDNNF